MTKLNHTEVTRTVGLGATPFGLRSKRQRPDWSNKKLKWIFAAPSLVLVIGMVAIPVLFTVFLSATNAKGSLARGFEFIGLENYILLLTDTQRFWPAVGRTIVFTGSAVAIQVVLGLAIALLLAKPFRGQSLVRVSMLLPVVATPVAVGMMWMMIFQPTIGVANEILRWFGIPPQGWISDPSQALPLIVLVDAWQWTPMVILILLAGLVSMPEEPLEAAIVDGANAWQRLIYVTLPLLRPALLAAVLLRAIDALKTFDILYTMKGPGGGSSNEVETLNIYGYTLSFQYANFGLASAMLIVFFAIVMAVCVALVLLRKKEK